MSLLIDSERSREYKQSSHARVSTGVLALVEVTQCCKRTANGVAAALSVSERASGDARLDAKLPKPSTIVPICTGRWHTEGTATPQCA